ncbi:MAG TPA: FAD-dependent oxidoreductase, partial [Acidimicrobiales bacterium]
GIAYFCGVMADQPDQASADKEVASSIEALLHDYATVLWPDATDDNGAFDWSHLYAPGRGAAPSERLAAQYLRANVVPTERYVLTPAGSTVHRLAPDALVVADPTGPDHCPNLYLAGDWTLNGVNGGCVEAATMSGMQAARAVCGTPDEVSGENVHWLSRVEQ